MPGPPCCIRVVAYLDPSSRGDLAIAQSLSLSIHVGHFTPAGNRGRSRAAPTPGYRGTAPALSLPCPPRRDRGAQNARNRCRNSTLETAGGGATRGSCQVLSGAGLE